MFHPIFLNDISQTLPSEIYLNELAFVEHKTKFITVLAQLKMTSVLSQIESGFAIHQFKQQALLNEIPYSQARVFGSFWRVKHWWVLYGYEVQELHDHFAYSSRYLAHLASNLVYKPTHIEPFLYHPDWVVPSGKWTPLLEMKAAITKAKLVSLEEQIAQLDEQITRTENSLVDFLGL